MLKSLYIDNFKSWKKADIKFGGITGFFGTNSSGKSSLLQFLLLLKQTKDATDRAAALTLDGDYVKLGTFRDLVHRNELGHALNWRLGFQCPNEIKLTDADRPDADPHANSALLTLETAVEQGDSTSQMETQGLTYRVGASSYRLVRQTNKRQFDLQATAGAFAFKRNQGRPWKLPGPIKSYAFPDQARTYYQNASFLADLERAYEEQLDRLFYLGPLRDYPQRDYLWARTRPLDVGVKGEKAIAAIAAATEAGDESNIKARGKNKPFQEIVAYWLKEIGVVHEFRVEEIKSGSNRWQALVRTHAGGAEAVLTDVGFGVSQVLPVITLLQYVPKGSTVILEQPEIHLHPLAQANLTDVIINAARHRHVQVIFESHSEHLLLRLQRRIAEEQIGHDDMSLYFCRMDRGASKAERLDVDMFGHINNWPENFMGDAFGETARAEKARLRRQIAAE